MKRSLCPLVLLLLAFACSSLANNIAVTNVKLTGQDSVAHTTLVQFDIKWDNSWRTSSGPANWDAAWVFVKYRVGYGPWNHAFLAATGNTAATGSTAAVGLLTPGAAYNATTNPGMGVFIYRTANGSGRFSATGAKLVWNYGVNGVANNALVDIQVYAIEQVYVPQAAYSLGSGAGSSSAFEYGSFFAAPSGSAPYKVTSENAITIGKAAGNMYYYNDPGAYLGDNQGPVPAAFPKGYNAFYCMKYELTQQGYADFLNSIGYATSRQHYDYNSTIGSYRFQIDTVFGSSTFISRNPYVACNYLSWYDLGAYLAWAGLRPMTELEYEKACRGTATPVPNENAWGTPNSATQYYSIANPGDSTEYVSAQLQTFSGVGNVSCYNTNGFVTSPTQGPLRTGIFAASATAQGSPDRATSGATYYGIMEMSGNVYERLVTIGNSQGRAFKGTHGKGALSASGAAPNTDWPAPTTAIGTGIRGGGFLTPNSIDSLSVSNRRMSTLSFTERKGYQGGRGVRTAP